MNLFVFMCLHACLLDVKLCMYLYSRSKTGVHQNRLPENQLSPPPPPATFQPDDNGYEYMAKGVGPTFNHGQIHISQER